MLKGVAPYSDRHSFEASKAQSLLEPGSATVRILALVGSPRRGGNTELLVGQVVAGALSTKKHQAETVFLDEYVKHGLADCKLCRNESGECSIQDRYKELMDLVLASNCLVIGTPLYWYGPSGILKNFIDRWFCYISDSYPHHREVIDGMRGRKVVLVVACEETGHLVSNYLVGMISEVLRYMRMQFIAVVIGDHSARRGYVRLNERAMRQAYSVGEHLDELEQRKYYVDSERPADQPTSSSEA